MQDLSVWILIKTFHTNSRELVSSLLNLTSTFWKLFFSLCLASSCHILQWLWTHNLIIKSQTFPNSNIWTTFRIRSHSALNFLWSSWQTKEFYPLTLELKFLWLQNLHSFSADNSDDLLKLEIPLGIIIMEPREASSWGPQQTLSGECNLCRYEESNVNRLQSHQIIFQTVAWR